PPRLTEARAEPGPGPVLQGPDLRGLRDALGPVVLRRGAPEAGRSGQPAADPLDQPPDVPAGGRDPEESAPLARAAPRGHAREAAGRPQLAADSVESRDAAAGAEQEPLVGVAPCEQE